MPMISRCITRWSAAGLSAETWLLKLTAYWTADLYCISRHYPLAQYAEMLSLVVQAFAMLLIVCFFQRRAAPAVGALVVLVAGGALLAAPDWRESVLPALQAGAAVLGASAVVPQIILNVQRSGSGEFSVITAALLTCGNALRGWTTLALADGDAVLLFGAALGFAINGTLLLQIIYFAQRDGRSLRALLVADFVQLVEPRADELALLRGTSREASDASEAAPDGEGRPE